MDRLHDELGAVGRPVGWPLLLHCMYHAPRRFGRCWPGETAGREGHGRPTRTRSDHDVPVACIIYACMHDVRIYFLNKQFSYVVSVTMDDSNIASISSEKKKIKPICSL